MKAGMAKLRVVVRCPQTHKPITNLILSRAALQQLWEIDEVWCPDCRTSHLWDRDNACPLDRLVGDQEKPGH